MQKVTSCHADLKMLVTKLKLRVFLAGHIVATVIFCATKLTATCSPMIGQFVDTMILASISTMFRWHTKHDIALAFLRSSYPVSPGVS